MFNNVIEINEMIDLIDDFVFSNNKQITVGGCCGTDIVDIVLESVLGVYQQPECLIVEGCQDIIGLCEKVNKKNYTRHIFYAEMFDSLVVDGINGIDEFKPMIFQPKPEYCTFLNKAVIKDYKCMIILNAHLIPLVYMRSITDVFDGKIISIIDPFDKYNIDIDYSSIPCITDTFNKLPLGIAFARNVYGIETRYIDKSIGYSLKELRKINPRSIGKIDNNQYVSNDNDLIEMIRIKQLDSRFRKNQKVIVSGDKIYKCLNVNGKITTVNKNSIIEIFTSSENPMIKLKLYSSNEIFMNNISYMNDASRNMIPVKPANIISVDDAFHHRFKNAVFIISGNDMHRSIKYSMIKNSMNMTIVNM